MDFNTARGLPRYVPVSVSSHSAAATTTARWFAIVIVALMAGVAAAQAVNDGVDGGDEAAQRGSIASNQSVSLNQAPPADDHSFQPALDSAPALKVTRESKPPMRPVEHESGASVEGDAGERESSVVKRGAGAVKRLRVGGGDVLISSPWYRTGLGALAVVLAAIGGLFWFLRKWVPSTRSTDSAILKTVARASLSPKHSAALLQLGRRYILVGVSPDGVRVLSDISDENEVAELATRIASGGRRSDADFQNLLGQEAGTYGDDESDLDEPLDHGAARSHAGSVPLSKLLTRVRSLQSRWKTGAPR